MSKSLKPSGLAIDWGRLLDRFAEIDDQRSIDELVPAWQRGEIPEPRWAPEYISALQRALEGNDESMLIELMDARRLAHPQLMPLFAELLRRKAQGLTSGRGSALTEAQKRFLFNRRAFILKGQRGTTYQLWADLLGVSKRTIESGIAEIARKK